MSKFDPNAAYDKYELYGAYHWAAAAPGLRFWKYSPHADANYLIALDQLRRSLAERSGTPTVLDLACGDGVMTYKMRKVGWRVIGLDKEALALSLTRAQLAKRGARAELVQASGLTLPLADGALDGLVAMELIEHIDPALNHEFVSELHRVLKPGGIAVITTPHKQTPELRSAYHTQEFSANAIHALFKKRFSTVTVYGYYSERSQRLYSFGGRPLRPLRLLWKALWRFPRLNPFMRLAADPGPEWEHIVAVARR